MIDDAGRLYLVGGRDTVRTYNGDEPSKLTQRFDPATGTVTRMADMSYQREHRNVAIAGDGNVYVMGGTSLLYCQRDVQRLDPETNRWRVAAPTLNSTCHSQTTVDDAGRLVRFGGATDNGFRNLVQRYDHRTNAWTAVAQLPTALAPRLAFTDRWGRAYSVGGRGWGGEKDLTFRLDADGTIAPVTGLSVVESGYTGTLVVPGETTLVLYGNKVERFT